MSRRRKATRKVVIEQVGSELTLLRVLSHLTPRRTHTRKRMLAVVVSAVMLTISRQATITHSAQIRVCPTACQTSEQQPTARRVALRRTERGTHPCRSVPESSAFVRALNKASESALPIGTSETVSPVDERLPQLAHVCSAWLPPSCP
jgi:hypothetical protein